MRDELRVAVAERPGIVAAATVANQRHSPPVPLVEPLDTALDAVERPV